MVSTHGAGAERNHEETALLVGNNEQGESEDDLHSMERKSISSSAAAAAARRKGDLRKFGPCILTLSLIVVLFVVVISVMTSGEKNKAGAPSTSTNTEQEGDWNAMAQSSLQSLNANLLASPSSKHCETTILLFRHCDDHGPYAVDDKEWGNKHCSHMGYKRSQYLASLFGTRWPRPRPGGLYALLPKQPKGVNFRQIETLLPLAKAINSTIHVVGDPLHLSTAIFASLQAAPDEMCHQVLAVAWKHAFIPEVAARLGCGPHQGCRGEYPDDDFDLVWMLQFVFEPSSKPLNEVMRLERQNSSLLSDDFGLLRQMEHTAALNDVEISTHEGWKVYGTVVNQFFDPLALAVGT